LIIDSHSHLKHGDEAHTEYEAETIVRVMDAAGIDKSVVFAMSTTTQRSIAMGEAAVREFPDRLIPYAYALPSFSRATVEELDEALGQRGFRGIKMHAGECSLAEHVIDPVLEVAAHHDVPCLIDCSGRFGEMADMCRRAPKTKLIIAHLGLYLCQDAGLIDRFVGLAEQYPNAYLDISGVVLPEKIAEAAARVGSAKVIWGIDGPHRNPTLEGYARAELEKVRALKLAAEVERDILGGSIARLMGVRARVT
jgi:predicted TIM-barrel fold metal-dependent hydrolase